MTETLKMKILDIQPSQLFISEDKLKEVSKWLNHNTLKKYKPIPIKKLNGRIIFTDGHTRAFALYKIGVELINISKLEERIITKEDYEILWINRCKDLQNDLDKKDN
ncbi:hypothetical protein [Senegalia sp. (in: firmicutes)]|uniref:hypothetical protein n=1 Tax=Senegalia sp. (in: firmicutes) TaxID=1924098 RepID=UPI003F98EE32